MLELHIFHQMEMLGGGHGNVRLLCNIKIWNPRAGGQDLYQSR